MFHRIQPKEPLIKPFLTKDLTEKELHYFCALFQNIFSVERW